MNEQGKNELSSLRSKLDNIDNRIVKLLAERFEITRKIGKFKKKRNLSPLDRGREDEIYKKLEKKADEFEIDSEMLKDIWKSIMTQSKKEHQ